MIVATTAAARRIGCSADPRGHLVGEENTAIAGRVGPWRMAGDVRPRQAPVSGPGLAEHPDRRDVPTARIVRSVIEQGV